jgi:hypothetical protein
MMPQSTCAANGQDWVGEGFPKNVDHDGCSLKTHQAATTSQPQSKKSSMIFSILIHFSVMISSSFIPLMAATIPSEC